MRQPFVWHLRVYWEDTDAGGVVYHSNYLKFFERARTEWLRSMGLHQSALQSEHNIVFAIRKMEIDFLQAARMDDELDASVHSVSLGGARMTFSQELTRSGDGEKIATAEVTAACLEADSFKPSRMPGWIRTEIINAE
jgi:acyl-CoA thioester hydrolase